jgi:hypothetical protein
MPFRRLSIGAQHPPAEGDVIDHIRSLVLGMNGVSDAEASVLLRVLDRLEKIQAEQGADVAARLASLVCSMWIGG